MRRRRTDPVPATVALAVFKRDEGCVAPRLGGTAMDCWGRLRIEHVKAEPRMGKRAEPIAERLVTLCEGHTESGMRGGYVWCTDKRNREAMREYLRSLPDLHANHVDPCSSTCPAGRGGGIDG